MSNEMILRSTRPDYQIPLQSVGQLVWNRLQQFDQNSKCIIEAISGNTLTIKQLISQANSIAVALLKRGITKSDRIACLSANTIPYAVSQFAAYFLGTTLVPLSPTFNIYELKKEIKNSGSTVILTSKKNAHYFDKIIEDTNVNYNNEQIKLVVSFDGNHRNYVTFSQLLEEGRDQNLERIPYFKIDPKDDIFMLIYTSGSTGLPKSTIISHYMIVAILIDILNSNHLEKPIFSLHQPFGHMSGSLYLPLWAILGGTSIIYEEYDDELILKSIEKYGINLCHVYPAFSQKLIKEELADKYDLSSLKLIWTAGLAFPGNIAKALIEKFNVIFREVYGLTECPVVTEFPDMNPVEFIPGNVGRVSANTQLKIVDLVTGHSLGPNINGEICVKGPKMFSGYLNNHSATEDAVDSDGWLHTGDIGHFDDNERIFITDRLKELIKYGTYQVSPAEIEQFLLTHEAVADVAVVGVKHQIDNQWPRAYVKLKDGKSVTEDEIKKYVSDSMGFTRQLRAGVVFVDKIPRISIGKIDRKYFKQLVNSEVIN